MNHQEATQIEAVDKYLLNEMTPEARDEFEEHFFDCLECSTDLRATAAFMEDARREFKNRPMVKPATELAAKLDAKPEVEVGVKPGDAQSIVPPRTRKFWQPSVLTFALAASLLVILYQNVVVYPRFKTEIAQLEAPEILPTVSLIGANSRGVSTGAVAIGNAKRIQLVFEIPTQDRFTSYEGLVYAPSGALLGSTQITSQAAKDTITMDAPTGGCQAGVYSLAVLGKSAGQSDTEIARYHFQLLGQ